MGMRTAVHSLQMRIAAQSRLQYRLLSCHRLGHLSGQPQGAVKVESRKSERFAEHHAVFVGEDARGLPRALYETIARDRQEGETFPQAASRLFAQAGFKAPEGHSRALEAREARV